MVALQTTEAVVPGSNPASLTVVKTLRTGRVTVYTVNLGVKRETSPWGQKKKKKKKKMFMAQWAGY